MNKNYQELTVSDFEGMSIEQMEAEISRAMKRSSIRRTEISLSDEDYFEFLDKNTTEENGNKSTSQD